MILIAKETIKSRYFNFEKGIHYKAAPYDGRTDVYGHTIDADGPLYMIFNKQDQVMLMNFEEIKQRFRIFTK